jgi:hypothetical protein
VFGWFRRRQDIDLWPAHVANLFESMRSDCPAAAYLFAATLYNGRSALNAEAGVDRDTGQALIGDIVCRAEG